MRYPRGLEKEARLAEALGWALIENGHMKWYDSAGIFRLVTSMTPNKGKRGVQNAKAQLKRLGIVA